MGDLLKNCSRLVSSKKKNKKVKRVISEYLRGRKLMISKLA
jgi:hypothetical protein